MRTFTRLRRRLGAALVVAAVPAAVLALPATASATPAVPAAPAAVAPAQAPTVTEPAPTPPLGWNSWNTFFCNIDEAKIRGAADAMVSSGMKAAGYQYVVVDDCWQDSTRDANGNLQADPTRFPSGMKALGDYIHSKGLKFGIYQAPVDKTCAQLFGPAQGSTGAQGREQQDANTFASWGVDFLKYDWCSRTGTLSDQVASFTKMRDALRATGRPIVYSINSNSAHANTGPDYDWGTIADMWRTTEDITTKWRSGCAPTADCFMGITEILDVQAGLTSRNGPGRYNDPDMLEVGVRNAFNSIENRSHMAMWALMASPLIAGNDIRSMSADVRSILTDPDVLAINQDPNGIQATRVRDDGNVEIWSKPMSDGSVAVALLNRGDTATRVSTNAAQVRLPAASSYSLYDVWTNATRNTAGTISASVPAHGAAVYRIRTGSAERTSFTLRPQSARKCLDVLGGVAGRATDTVLWNCNSGPSQDVAQVGSQLVVGGVCLDAFNRGTADGTRVVTWECNGQTNQAWTLGSDGTVRGTATGKCLTAPTTGRDNVVLTISTCTGATNQRWTRG